MKVPPTLTKAAAIKVKVYPTATIHLKVPQLLTLSRKIWTTSIPHATKNLGHPLPLCESLQSKLNTLH